MDPELLLWSLEQSTRNAFEQGVTYLAVRRRDLCCRRIRAELEQLGNMSMALHQSFLRVRMQGGGASRVPWQSLQKSNAVKQTVDENVA
jgi:hypothetical protein